MTTPILEMKNITKSFPGVKALQNVNFRVMPGEIHCIVGENGAGKSTLMKVLSGVYAHGQYSGEILFAGKEQKFSGISDSERVGIAIIYQELALVPELSVYENLFLGHELRQGFRINWNETILQAGKMLKKVNLKINPATKIKELGIGKQQLVEIAKALGRNVKLLILDEPTAALNEDDSTNLLELIKRLKEQGVACVLISHKLKEVIAIADAVTVLRDGQTICTLSAEKNEIDENTLIKQMVGREIENIYPPRQEQEKGPVVLELRNWSAYSPQLGRQLLRNVNFQLRKGEIIGFAGLMGSGRTELALSIFGNPLQYTLSGQLLLNGQTANFSQPREAIRAGIAYVSEDRKGNGLILTQDVKQNVTLANLQAIAQNGIVNTNAEIKIANEYKHSLNIKTPTVEQIVGNLSGGNQQKVALGKWLFAQPSILILDEPTRGIDVGAKFEIYTLMNRLVEQGLSIIMISSELPEVLGMSDRIYTVSAGQITGELTRAEASQEKIMQLATQH